MAKDEREFRIRPRRPVGTRRADDARAWSVAFKRVLHYARMSKGAGRRQSGSGPAGMQTFNQRCAVRVMYSPNKTAGHWRAHGRYIARESTNHRRPEEAGFDRSSDSRAVESALSEWQAAGDPRLFKLIISPEFGERVNLYELTRGLMAQMETDLGTKLQWVAVAHFNTEHPHVHVALRGIQEDGAPLKLDRQYIKSGIRNRAEHLCTAQLGHRTQSDAIEAERREVREPRFTSLDRIIKRADTGTDASHFTVTLDTARRQHFTARLVVLTSMGLAESTGPSRWRVRRDFETVLRAMQRANDRQKMLAAHGALLSDPRLPMQLTDVRSIQTLEGRVIAHGEEETTGRNYLLLEGTDAKVHFIYHTAEIEAARTGGQLRPNSFARLHRIARASSSSFDVIDLGNAEQLLRNSRHLRDTAQRLIRRGIVPRENGWGGWLGRYQRALSRTADELVGPATGSSTPWQHERLSR